MDTGSGGAHSRRRGGNVRAGQGRWVQHIFEGSTQALQWQILTFVCHCCAYCVDCICNVCCAGDHGVRH